jgi:putative aldouronate transport system permease protein
MKKERSAANHRRFGSLYIFAVIPALYFIIFCYTPIFLQFILSFKDYKLAGLWASPWVGFSNYKVLFESLETSRVITNTLVISSLRLVIGFFPPIILAILLFDMNSPLYRRISQSILYIPHFFSWVVVYAIVQSLFLQSGYINSVIASLGGEARLFLMDKKYFYPLLFGADLWKEVGWGTIIYLAALTNIDPQLFEAARVDGAGPIQRIIHITIPGILPVAGFCLTMALGGIFSNTGTEQILLFYSPATYSVGDVIGTWVYRRGLGEFQYGVGAAVSQFQSVIGLILVLFFNRVSRKHFGVGIW